MIDYVQSYRHTLLLLFERSACLVVTDTSGVVLLHVVVLSSDAGGGIAVYMMIVMNVVGVVMSVRRARLSDLSRITEKITSHTYDLTPSTCSVSQAIAAPHTHTSSLPFSLPPSPTPLTPSSPLLRLNSASSVT